MIQKGTWGCRIGNCRGPCCAILAFCVGTRETGEWVWGLELVSLGLPITVTNSNTSTINNTHAITVANYYYS